MAFQVSPGVNISEVDLSTTIPNVSVSDAAMAAGFQWGPADKVTTVTSEKNMVDIFGKPDNETVTNWLTAASFLAYAGSLQIVRTLAEGTGTSLNAADNAGGILVANEAEFDAGISFAAGTTFVARYPGALGNSLGVGLIHRGSGATVDIGATTHTWTDLFDSVPNAGGTYDNLVHVFVTDSLGLFTGTIGKVLERFAYVSIASDAKDAQGNSNYIVDVIRNQSKYIYCTGLFDANANLDADGEDDVGNWDSLTATTDANDLDTNYGVTLTNGAANNTNANVTGQRQAGYDLFKDAEQTDVSLFIIGEDDDFATTNHVSGTVITGSSGRKDAVVFVSPKKASVQTAGSLSDKAGLVIADRANVDSTTYGFMDSGWKRMYNKYTDKFVAVPLNGDIAGLCVATDNTRDPWFSPAGFSRGHIKNAASLYFDPDKASRDTLYKAGVNPVASFPGQGIVLFGDKTLYGTSAGGSAFDRINVRRLFIVLEKAISRASKSMLFEFNDEFTRAQFRSMVEPFLRNVKSRRGITDFLVVCDQSNNTADVVDRNEFVGDIFIKPARSINFIQLNFVAVSTGVSFSEVVGAV
tara:strand:+ start:222 stop:1967 length:1746 start_codon:yes stop_codon:yes gene_type:complete